jgi:aspartyl-tRNA(Asn)/glutamyl-tRNA(Gln) amidotransferase subunit A
MNDLTDLTISEASDLLAKRKISATELVEATLRRIDGTDPAVRAYARVLDDDARRAAQHVDREIARGKRRGPLHGIPIAVKDNCYTRNIPTECGSRVLSDFVPGYDATVVRRLRDVGSLIIGKTICHEFAYGVNEPPTRNPWNILCYPGGSSAGSGVSVAVRSAFGSIGTDTGGSIRIPASMNGIVGLKPTYGRVSSYGVIPLATSLDHVGPLTRTVEDCALMLQAIAGYDPLDAASINHPVPDFCLELENGVNGLRIGLERDYFFYDGVTEDVRESVEKVITEYQDQGAEIVELKIPELESSIEVVTTIMLAEASAYHRHLLRDHASEYDPATRGMLELGEFVPATHYLTAQRARSLMRDTVAGLFKAHDLDAMLWPTIPLPTVPLDGLFDVRRDRPGETPMQAYIHHTFSANITGQPAITVPCGLSSTGLPVGFQLLGRPFAEGTLFRIARAYERTHTWFALFPKMAN